MSSKAEMDEKRETANATAGRNKTPGTDVVNDLLSKRKDPLQPNVGESCLTYKSVFKNVDFNYSVGSFGVKENIFVYAPLPEYVFDFTIRATGLILTPNENGEIVACNEDGEAIFLIPAPNMTDADGNYSESVCYELTHEDDDSYILSVRAEKDWLNDSERSFPVKIDPSVYPVGKQTADSLTFYDGDKTGIEYNRARIRFGKSDSGMCGGLISFPNDNNRFCSSGYQLAYGKLKYYVRSVGSGEAGTTDYRVRSIKTTIPLEKMTGLDLIEKSDSPVLLNGSVAAGKSLSGKVTNDGRWEEVYFTPESFGDSPDYVFLWEAVASNENQYGEVDIRDGNLPSVLSYYVSTVGIREDLPYEQFEYNGGTASVNLINGALTSAFDVLSIDVAQNPLSLQLVYNDSYDDIMTEYGMYNMFGKNIKINFQQVIKCDSGSARYIDEDGSVETFFSCSNGTYRSVDKNLSFLPSGATLYVNGNTKMYFSDDRVTEYHDASDIVAEKTMYKIKYSGNRITGIDGYTNNKKTHYIDFSYSDGVVTSAAAYLSTAVDGGSFRNIAECVFIYDDDGHLTEIRNNNSGNKKFVLGYDGDRLTGITDFDGNGYLFGRTHWSDSSPMRMTSVHSTYGDKSESGSCFYNYNGYTTFSAYDPKITKTEYYDAEEKKIGERNVDRCFGDTASSEWYVDDKGEISVSAMTAGMSGNDGEDFLTYTRSDFVTKEKRNTSFGGNNSVSVSPGNSVDGNILQNHGIVSGKGREYCLSLKLESFGSACVNLYVEGIKRGTIKINGTTESYYVIPVPYYSGSAVIKIENTGDNAVALSDVSYNRYTRKTTVKKIVTSSLENYVAEIETTAIEGKQIMTFDRFGRPETITQEDYTTSPTETKKYVYTYETGRSQPDCTRIRSITDGENTVEYAYTQESGEKITTAIVRKGDEPISKTTTAISGALGNYYEKKTENGVTVKTEYSVLGGNIRPYRVTADDSVTEYSYNYDGNVTAIKVDNGEGIDQAISYHWENGKASHYYIGDSDYAMDFYLLTRDPSLYYLVTGIKHNGTQMLSFGYDEYGNVNSVTYANKASVGFNYDHKTLRGVELRDFPAGPVTAIDYDYTGNDLTGMTQSVAGIKRLSYLFEESETQSKTTVSGDINASYLYHYDEETGMPVDRVFDFENGRYSRTEDFTFDGHGKLLDFGDGEFRTVYGYDGSNRVSSQKIQLRRANSFTVQYEYATVSDGNVNYQTNRIGRIANTSTGTDQTYTYDSKGYVRSYRNGLNGDNFTYTYDATGRLLSDGTAAYTYDRINNITSMKSGGKITTYSYQSAKETRLNSVSENGVAKYFRYDEMGNMIAYKGATTSASQNLFWTRGNMLEKGKLKDDKSFVYRYDPDNLRYSKTVNGTETDYYWDNGVLVGEKTGDNYIQYLYNASGIAGMRCNDSYYYFEKNIFGDVIRAYNASGIAVAEFRYDSYGNIVSASGSMADKVKIRYRGYYWDEETGFYYLQSRYYDPSLCRFISADQYELLGTLSRTPGQLNLYAYCNNNPIMYTDETGHIPEWILGIGRIITGIGAIVAGALVIASGVALVPMLIVAGVTIAAGVLTTVNGMADVQQSITGNNFVRDGIFCGNQTAYNWYAGVTEGVSVVGSLICGGWLKANQPRIQAYKNIGNYAQSKTVASHSNRVYNNSILLQKQIIKYGKMTKDLQSATGYIFSVAGSLNGNVSYWRLVLSNAERIIWHFGFGF